MQILASEKGFIRKSVKHTYRQTGRTLRSRYGSHIQSRETPLSNPLCQLTRADCYQEVIAFIRRLVDAYDKGEARVRKERQQAELARDQEAGNLSVSNEEHNTNCSAQTFKLKSAERRWTSSDHIEQEDSIEDFDVRLRTYFNDYMPDANVGCHPIRVSGHS
jgi:hypothetical protein